MEIKIKNAPTLQVNTTQQRTVGHYQDGYYLHMYIEKVYISLLAFMYSTHMHACLLRIFS